MDILTWVGENWTMIRDMLALLILFIIFLLSLRFVRRKEFEDHKEKQELINKSTTRDILTIQHLLPNVATHKDVADIKGEMKRIEQAVEGLVSLTKAQNNTLTMINTHLLKGNK